MTRAPRSYAEAMELLDLRRKGAEMPESFILIALELTGDYEPPARYVGSNFKRLFEPTRA